MPDDDVVSLSVFVSLSLFNSLGHGSVTLFSFEEKRTKGMEAIPPTGHCIGGIDGLALQKR